MTPPSDAVTSSNVGAANLRCFFGRQLRAWGEVEAAGELRRVPDDRVLALRAAQEKLGGPIVDDVVYANIVLHAVAPKKSAPRRKAPSPRLFQYHVLHEPFAP